MQKFRKIFRSRKHRSLNSPDGGGGFQARPPLNSSPAVIQQAPAPHAPGTATSAVPTPSSTPAAGSDTAPFVGDLGSVPLNDDATSNGTPVLRSTAEDDPVATGNASEIPEPETSGDQTLPAPALADAVLGAHDKRDVAGLIGTRSSNAVQVAQHGTVTADDWDERIDNLFKQLSAFCDVLGNIGEIHPYVRLVTGFINAGIQPILKQKARDDAMKKLIEDMDYAFDKVMADDEVKRGEVIDNNPRCKLFAQLAKQTVDCAWFIRAYYLTTSFMKRALKGIVDYNVDEKIKQYSAVFVELGDKIAKCEISETVKFVTTISITVAQIDATLALQELIYAEGTGRQNDKACLTGTRVSTLDCIADWIVDPDAARIRFVVGVAGSGKSSIAHSIASRFHDLGRLGAFFAFDRADPRLRPWSVFSTLARELADWNADFRHELSAVLSQKGRVAKSRDVIEQWEDLIVRPAQKVHFVGPVLIVVDAFDECTDLRGPASAFDREQQDRQRARKNLLECLTNRIKELPRNFRILVTSRLEEDVVAVADSALRAPASCAVVFSDLGQAEVEAHEGIGLYIRHELQDSLRDEQIAVLVDASDRLFEWAATACRYLLDSVAGSTVFERYTEWFEGQAGIVHEASRSLELLYRTILGQRFTDKAGLKRFRDVMAQVLYAAEPVSWDTLVALRRAVDESDNVVNLVIPHLGSLLSGVGEHSVLIRPLHTSFRDFLTRADLTHSWHLLPGDIHDVTAKGALCVLNKSLHFDIWNFPSSYTENCFVDDIDDRMKKLPAGIAYASRHWSYHLSAASKSAASLQTELRVFLTQKLLFWLEVASLCKFIHRAVPFMLSAASFFKPMHDDDVIAFINDAISFVRHFIEPMQQSVPHIYLSALSFCPTTSLIRRIFVRNENLLPTVDGLAAEWPIGLCPHRVSCFARSPNGICMALGCMDGTVRLADAENMHKSVLELAHHSGSPSLWVGCVAFSPDGQIVAAAAQTGDAINAIFRWDAGTGEMLGISRGHTDRVNSMCFSSDGRYIVSASEDRTVRRWDVRAGKQVDDPLRGHTDWVTSVVCSLNGEFIISGGNDATIRIWGSGNGQQDGPPILLPGRRPFGITLARSPKANLIAVGMASEDSSSVWVFDFDQRCFVRELLHQRHNGVPRIAWSYDGRCIASAFKDGSILLWDSFDSSSISLYTSTTLVDAILFSPDGNRLIFRLEGGHLATVDISAAQSQSSECDTRGRAEYAAYSPDGRFVAVTFGDKKDPYVWDAETGASLSDDRTPTESLTWLKPAMDKPLQHYHWYDWDVRKINRPHDIVSANGNRSAGVWGEEISIWDSASQTLLWPSISIPSGKVTCVALSPSGDYVLQGTDDGTVRIFHVEQSAANIPLPDTDSDLGTQRSHGPEDGPNMPALRPGRSEGWLYDNDDQQIIRVAYQYHAHLWLPGLRHILRPNREPARQVKIDFSGVGLGTEWARCAGALSVDLGNARDPFPNLL